MNARKATAALLMLTVLGAPQFVSAADSIVQSVRTLQHIQAAIARGDVNARSSQPALMKKIGGMIGSFDAHAKHDRREFASIAIYLLSGGDANRVAGMFKEANVKEQAPYVFGALAYVTGHQREALSNLKLADALAISPGLAAHTAYALSVLKTDENRQEALTLLATARITAPGTLIEEVALRREILLLVQSGDLSAAARLMRNYYLRFSKSPYASEFTRTLTASIVLRAKEAGEQATKAAIEGSVPMSAESRASFMLSIAREVLVNGAFPLARSITEATKTIAPAGSESARRADLYYLVSDLLSGGTGSSQKIVSLDPNSFSGVDRDLATAAKGIAAQINAPVSVSATPNASDMKGPKAATMESGERILTATSNLLAKQ